MSSSELHVSKARRGGERKMPAPQYVTLGKGIKALQLWKSLGPVWPQITVLELSSGEYKKFLKNPKSYLNILKIYGKKPTRKVFRCRLAPFLPKKPGATYVVIAKHDVDCTTVAGSSSKVAL